MLGGMTIAIILVLSQGHHYWKVWGLMAVGMIALAYAVEKLAIHYDSKRK